MITKLIRLPDGTWVNPAHVAMVVFNNLHPMDGGPTTSVSFADGRMGVVFPGDCRDELAKLINGEADK